MYGSVYGRCFSVCLCACGLQMQTSEVANKYGCRGKKHNSYSIQNTYYTKYKIFSYWGFLVNRLDDELLVIEGDVPDLAPGEAYLRGQSVEEGQMLTKSINLNRLIHLAAIFKT